MSGIRTRTLTPNEKLRMVYHRMNQSTTDQKHESFVNYGALGIYVDKADWPTASAFVAWAWESGYVADAGLSIDRINNAGPYSKKNCRWVDRKTQQRNMRTNRRFPYQGEELTAGEILERHQGSYTLQERNALYYKLRKGWPADAALSPDAQAGGFVQEKAVSAGQRKYQHEGRYYNATDLITHFHGECTTAMYCLFFRRLKKGWSVAEAASSAPFTSRYDERNQVS